MQTLQNKLLALAGVIILALIGSLMSSRQTAAQAAGAAPVMIVGPLPLPVTGSSTVTGSVAATQSGTWNVVTRNSDEPARMPYQTLVSGSEPYITVPDGKRLVIQNVAFFVLPSNKAAAIHINVDDRGTAYFPLTVIGVSSAGTEFGGSFPFTAYVDGGESVQFFNESNNFGTNDITATVTGYLIDCASNCKPIAP